MDAGDCNRRCRVVDHQGFRLSKILGPPGAFTACSLRAINPPRRQPSADLKDRTRGDQDRASFQRLALIHSSSCVSGGPLSVPRQDDPYARNSTVGWVDRAAKPATCERRWVSLWLNPSYLAFSRELATASFGPMRSRRGAIRFEGALVVRRDQPKITHHMAATMAASRRSQSSLRHSRLAQPLNETLGHVFSVCRVLFYPRQRQIWLQAQQGSQRLCCR